MLSKQIHSKDIDIVLPPWIVFPSIDQHDVFWRMGIGEDYITNWAKSYLNSDKEKYKQLFPANKDWKDIYEI